MKQAGIVPEESDGEQVFARELFTRISLRVLSVRQDFARE